MSSMRFFALGLVVLCLTGQIAAQDGADPAWLTRATSDLDTQADGQEWPWEHSNTLGAPPSFVHLNEAAQQESEGLLDAEKSFKMSKQASLMEQDIDIDNGWVARTEAATDTGGKEATAASHSALESAALQAAADEAQLSMGAIERAVDAMDGVKEAVATKAAAIVEAAKETAKLAAIVPHEDVEGESADLRKEAMAALEEADKASEDAQITRTAAFRVAEKQMNIANAAREKVGKLEEQAFSAGEEAAASHEVARDASNEETSGEDLTENTGEWPWEHEETLGPAPALVDTQRAKVRSALSSLLDMGTFKTKAQQQQMYDAQANALHEYDAQAWTIHGWHGLEEEGDGAAEAAGDENLDVTENHEIDDRKRRSLLAARAAQYATQAAQAVVKEAKAANYGLSQTERAAEAEKKATSALALAAVKAQEKAQLHADAVSTAAQLASAISNDDVKEANSLRGDAANEARKAEEASATAVEAERYASQVASLQNEKAIEAEESARKAAQDELKASELSQVAETHATQAAEDEARMAENFDDDHESAKHAFIEATGVTYDCGAVLGAMKCPHAKQCCNKYNINCPKANACIAEAKAQTSFLVQTGGEDKTSSGMSRTDCWVPTTQLMPMAVEECCNTFSIACDSVGSTFVQDDETAAMLRNEDAVLNSLLESGTFKSAAQKKQVEDASSAGLSAHDSNAWTLSAGAVSADADDTRERRAKFAARAATYEAAAAAAAANEAQMAVVAVTQTERAREAEATTETALRDAAAKSQDQATLHADAVEAHAQLAAAVEAGKRDEAETLRQEVDQKTKAATEATSAAVDAQQYAANVAVAQAAKARKFEKQATIAAEKGTIASEEGHRAANEASQAAHDEMAQEAVLPEDDPAF